MDEEDRATYESLSMEDQVYVGKEMSHFMQKERDRLQFEVQKLRDSVSIQESVGKESNFNKKMAKMKNLLRNCDTTKFYIGQQKKHKQDSAIFARKVAARCKRLMQNDMTRMPLNQNSKLLSKQEVKKKYPQFSEDNQMFYLQLLIDSIKKSLGIITRDQVGRTRYKMELDRAELIIRRLEVEAREYGVGDH